MAFMCIVNLPLFYIYGGYEALGKETSWLSSRHFLGNMGQVTTGCAESQLIAGQLYLSCNTGKISKLVDFGVYAQESKADFV